MATNSKFIADIGIKTDSDLQIGGNATIDGNATVSGNLTVNGTSLTVNATTTSVEDNMLELANANTSSDTLDIGIYGNYDDGLSDGGATEYTGLFRDASDSTWKLFDGLEVAPTTTVNTSGTGYTLADLTVGDLTATTLTATNGLTGSSITYPTSDGTNGQVITTNGSGTLSFGDIPAGYTDSDARSAISVSGNLAYNSSTGVISYSEPTMYADSDARSAISAGTGISYDSSTGVITNTVSNTDTTYSAGTGLTLTGTTFSNNITQYTDSDVGTYLSSNGYATQSTIVAAITDSAPATLDTLNELAAALGDDANFSTTVTNSIALKAPLASPVFSGTVDMGTFGNRTRAFEAYGSNVLFDGGSDSIDLIIGDGSSAYMSIQTTDTASAMNIRDYSGNADLVTIERTTGNVGINQGSPNAKLDVKGDYGSPQALIGYSDGDGLFIHAQGGSTHTNWCIGQQKNISGLEFTPSTTAGGTTFSNPAMAITSSGNLLIGTASDTLSGTDSGFVFKADGNASFVTGTGIMYMRRTTSDSVHIKFRSTTNASVGQISSDGSNTTYSTSSDYRLKENVSYDWDATTRLKQLKPARFNFLQGNTETQDGFLAHEVQSIVPIAVEGIKDAVDENGDVDPQSIDHSKLVPLLVKTIQELEERITTLESE